MSTTAPADKGVHFEDGQAETSILGRKFGGFSKGDPLYFGIHRKATRVSGFATDVLICKVHWYDGLDALISTSSHSINIAGTIDWTFTENKVTAPGNALNAQIELTFSPGAVTTQHDLWLTGVRLDSTAYNATEGADWDENLTGVPANLVALVGTENINNQAVLDSIANDDILSVQEKMGPLSKLVTDLDTRYTDLYNRANGLAISTAALTTARTAWKTYLDSLNPKYTDFTQDTVLFTSTFPDKNFPSGWSTAGSASQGTDGVYTTIIDGGTGLGYIGRTQSGLSGSNNYAAGIVIKKDAITSRFGRLEIVGTGGTAKTGGVNINTSTGATGGSANVSEVTVLDMGEAWFLGFTFATTGNTSLQLRFYPAFTALISATSGTNGTAGTIAVRSPVLTGPGKTVANLGRNYMTGLLGNYSAQMAALAAAISQKDGSTSVIIDPLNDVIVYADSTGTVTSGQLPMDVYISASIGTANVTTLGTWTRTTVSGVTATIGASTGILNITALSAAEVLIPISFSYNGVTRNALVHVVKNTAPPTYDDGGGGGGGGTSSTTTLGNTTATTYDLTNAISATLTVNTGTGTVVNLTANVPYKAVDNISTPNVWGKWQWRAVAGVWADVATEQLCDYPPEEVALPGGGTKTMPGLIDVTYQKTGLTTATNYEFRFAWRDSGQRCTKSGTIILQGSS